MPHARDLASLVIELIEKLKAGVYLLPEQDRLLFYGIHVLAAARTAELWPAWCDLLRLPPDRLDDLFGDHVVTVLVGVTLSLVGDDAPSLFEIVETQSDSGDVRWALFQVLARLTWERRIDLECMRAFLERFERDALATEDDTAWLGWLDATVLLGLTGLMPAIERVLAKQPFAFPKRGGSHRRHGEAARRSRRLCRRPEIQRGRYRSDRQSCGGVAMAAVARALLRRTRSRPTCVRTRSVA